MTASNLTVVGNKGSNDYDIQVKVLLVLALVNFIMIGHNLYIEIKWFD